MLYKLTLVVLNLFLVVAAFAQSVDKFYENQEASDFDKLYLSTDREFYFIGDTLWFSPYIVHARSQYLSTDNCNLYVELVSDKGEKIEERNFLLINGMCSGYIILDSKIVPSGNYLLRAYTDRTKRLGTGYYFKKTIKVNATRQSHSPQDFVANDDKKVILDFYPEGGFLLEGAANQMAFVAHNQDGKRVNFVGELQCSDGALIKVKTDYNGTGSFLFMPHSDQKYTIVAEDNKKLQYQMPEFREHGAKVTVLGTTSDAVKIMVAASCEMQDRDYYVAVLHRGEGFDCFKIEKGQLARPIPLKTKNFGVGINRLVLLNDRFEPLSERLVFVNNDSVDLSVHAKTDKKEYNTREQVKMEFSIPELKDDEVWARISVAVVNENMVGAHGALQNIKSYLLLDSELKGQIQTPGLYFVDDDSVSSSRKLDLLLLTNGWSNYIWTDIKTKKDFEIPDAPFGLMFDGNVKKNLSGKPFAGTVVLLNYNNNNVRKVEITKTDENGYFRFDSILVMDTASVVIQAKNNKGKKYTQLEANTLGMQHADVDASEYENIDDIGQLSFECFRLKYLNELALSEFFPDRESKLIEEVKVVGDKIEEKPDNHFRMYTPDKSMKLTDLDRSGSRNVLDYLNHRFYRTRYQTGNLYLLDGFPVDSEDISNIPIWDVDVVDVIVGPETAIFGMKGATSVISVFTRDAGIAVPEDGSIPGTLVEKIRGFERFRSFYSPAYDTININSAIPDYRQTLYWNPAILINGKEEQASFFTCDNLSKYKVLVEGITNSGKICLGETEFVVNVRR